jgi:hypothetical protein
MTTLPTAWKPPASVSPWTFEPPAVAMVSGTVV